MHPTKQFKSSICTNCGINGHHYKACTEPITSYGIIAFRITDNSWNQSHKLSEDDLVNFPLSSLEFLMVQRRDSIGYIEILRAKYKVTDIQYIADQIAGMVQEERNALLTKSFDELWFGLWGTFNSGNNRQYKQEYDQAKVKFEVLRNGFEHNGAFHSFKTICDSTPIQWDTPEWGFPKGRRNVFETDYKCAVREFCEETSLRETDLRIIENLEPIRETFFGNNGIHYCHIYYLAYLPSHIKVRFHKENQNMVREIGDIGWFNLDNALLKIRSTNIEKKEIILRASSLIKNVIPLFIGPCLFNMADQSDNQEGFTVSRNGRDERSRIIAWLGTSDT
jgi:8-oxo-dGTP pyrophosphatase MutT (NUDIX family)